MPSESASPPKVVAGSASSRHRRAKGLLSISSSSSAVQGALDSMLVAWCRLDRGAELLGMVKLVSAMISECSLQSRHQLDQLSAEANGAQPTSEVLFELESVQEATTQRL